MVAMIPITQLYMYLVPCILVIMALGLFLLMLYQNGKEGFLFRKARAKNLPLLDIQDVSTRRGWLVLGTYEDDRSPIFEIEGISIHIRPEFTSGDCAPDIINGVEVYHFDSNKSNPISSNTKNALATMERHRHDREEWSEVDFLISRDLFTLIRTNRDDLLAASMLFVQQYTPSDLSVDTISAEDLQTAQATRMAEIIVDMQEYYFHLPIETGNSCYHAAMVNNPYAHSSQDMERIITKVEERGLRSWMGKFNFAIYGTIIIGIIMASGIVIYILAKLV